MMNLADLYRAVKEELPPTWKRGSSSAPCSRRSAWPCAQKCARATNAGAGIAPTLWKGHRATTTMYTRSPSMIRVAMRKLLATRKPPPHSAGATQYSGRAGAIQPVLVMWFSATLQTELRNAWDAEQQQLAKSGTRRQLVSWCAVTGITQLML